jgi:hypothetical protein
MNSTSVTGTGYAELPRIQAHEHLTLYLHNLTRK